MAHVKAKLGVKMEMPGAAFEDSGRISLASLGTLEESAY